MEQTQAMIAKLTAWLRGGGGRKALLVAGIAGIALLALSELRPARSASAEVHTQTAAQFAKETEERLTELVGSIEGAGACRVLVTLQNGVEYVYATEQKTNSDRQEDDTRLTQRDDSETSAIVVDTGNGREGLLVTEIQPTVRGVVVVCEGGDRADVRQRIIEAVTVAMDLSSKRVCVTKLS